MSMSWQIVQELDLEDVNSVPFPSNTQTRANPRPISAPPSPTPTSRSSGFGPYHLRAPTQSVSRSATKHLSLSPVAEEWEQGFHHTRAVPNNQPNRPQQRPVGRGDSGLLAEEITMAMMMIPPSVNTNTSLRPREPQGFRSSARRRIQRFMSFVRGRLPTPHHQPENR